MRIEVDLEACEGHGLCEQAAPDIYRVTEDGLVEIHQPDGSEAQDAAADLGARVCPVAALRTVR